MSRSILDIKTLSRAELKHLLLAECFSCRPDFLWVPALIFAPESIGNWAIASFSNIIAQWRCVSSLLPLASIFVPCSTSDRMTGSGSSSKKGDAALRSVVSLYRPILSIAAPLSRSNRITFSFKFVLSARCSTESEYSPMKTGECELTLAPASNEYQTQNRHFVPRPGTTEQRRTISLYHFLEIQVGIDDLM